MELKQVYLHTYSWDTSGDLSLERAKGIEPSYRAWEALVLPLNYARVESDWHYSAISLAGKIKHGLIARVLSGRLTPLSPAAFGTR